MPGMTLIPPRAKLESRTVTKPIPPLPVPSNNIAAALLDVFVASTALPMQPKSRNQIQYEVPVMSVQGPEPALKLAAPLTPVTVIPLELQVPVRSPFEH